MTTANKITLTRIAMIPFFIYFAAQPMLNVEEYKVGIFSFPTCTLADKLLVSSALILFVEQKAMAGWMVCVILARELIITSLRVVAANKGVVMAATWTGKVKTCVQIGGIIIIYLHYIIFGAVADGESALYSIFAVRTEGDPVLIVVGWVVTLVTIYSGYDYLKKNWDLIKDGAVKAK